VIDPACPSNMRGEQAYSLRPARKGYRG